MRVNFLFFISNRPGRRLKANLSEAESRLVSELEAELSRVKSDLDAAGQEEEKMKEEERVISEELGQSETQVRSLRSQMDQLTQEIKQANLQSLSIAPADDLKILLEGKILIVINLSFVFVLPGPWNLQSVLLFGDFG